MEDGGEVSIPADLRGLVGAGFKRSAGWMHTLAAICAFTADVLKPLLPHCTPALMIVGFFAFILVWVLTRVRWIHPANGAGVLVFLLMTTALSTTVYAAEQASGDPPEGEFAHVSPAIERLQRALKIIDARTQRIEQKTDKIIALLKDRAPAKPSAIASHIEGMWGEGDCSAVSYRFARRGPALTIEGINRPAGAAPYRFAGTIIQETELTLEVRGEAPETARGLEVTFVYETNGVTERLQWQDHVPGSTALELNRCG